MHKLFLSSLAALAVVNAAHADLVRAGVDLLVDDAGAISTYDLDVGPDVFAPGTDPSVYPDFEVRIDPPVKAPDSTPGDADSGVLVMRRTADVEVPDNIGSQADVPIELLAITLYSAAPLEAPASQGNPPELWDLKIELTPGIAAIGVMSVVRESADGGVFTSSIVIQPRIQLTRVSDGRSVSFYAPPETLLTSSPVPWSHTQPSASLPLSQPIQGLSQSNFWPGVTASGGALSLSPFQLDSERFELSLTLATIPEPSALGLAVVSLMAVPHRCLLGR